MAVLWWTCYISLPVFIHCYVDICTEATCRATLSTTLEGHGADKVIDGNTAQFYSACSHTATRQSSAFVEVDLGDVYHLKNIVIYYRTEGNWKPYRFRKFVLSVTRRGNPSQWITCHRDTTDRPALPLSIQNITCKESARYVRVATTYDAPEDGIFGAILEVCEIKVYGRFADNCNNNTSSEVCEIIVNGCNVGFYGPSCSSCGGCHNCDIETGCLACSPNCVDSACDMYGNCIGACSLGFWGRKCTSPCQHSKCLNNACNKGDGNCLSCTQGYYGDTCSIHCSTCSGQTCYKTGFCTNGCIVGYYGNNCERRCGNCNPDTCDRNNGFCNVCEVGYFGDKCERACSTNCFNYICRKSDGYCLGCSKGSYGSQCKKICNDHCVSRSCDQNTGQCNKGCEIGYYGSFCNLSCSPNCAQAGCYNNEGTCIGGCKTNWAGITCDECDLAHYGFDCSAECSASCQTGCDRDTGNCKGTCDVGKYGNFCNNTCNLDCRNGCQRDSGNCEDCVAGQFGAICQNTCGRGCNSNCAKTDGSCTCKVGWQGSFCDECNPYYYGALCEHACSLSCLNGTCFSNNGSCIGGCNGDYIDEKCTVLARSMQTSFPTTPVAVGAGVALILLILIIISAILFIRLRRRKHSESQLSSVLFHKECDISSEKSAENKLYTNIGNVSVPIEDPEEEPQKENPEDAVYYNDLSVAKDIALSDLLNVITQREGKEKDGFQKEFKSLPYGERFACEIAKTAENMPKNRFKTTFPYDHSRVILEMKGFTSDYINANYIENTEGKREFIACQGPRENTLVDHWRMIWQEHVEYIVMLTNLIEGPKVKCHQYWPDEGKELDINPFSVTLVEEKVYAYFVERKMTVQKKRVTGSKTVVQYHYTRWPDHGTPNPLNLVVFHRHFRHKVKPSQHPIVVHCSAGIGRTGTFIALDVLSRYGKDKGKVNVKEYVKAMRKDRMTMIQNVDQYVFLYHALFEFFRRKSQYRKKDDFLGPYGDVNKIDTQKQLTNEFNELISLKPRYDAHDFKSGKKFLKLNFTKSILPVEEYLVYLTSHLPGRESYYNAVNVSSFTRAEEFISAQFPVPGAAIDLVRLLIDHESAFLISLNPLSEVKELQSWIEENNNPVKLSPYTITKGTVTSLTKEIRKTTINISKKEGNTENHEIQIFECLNWSSIDALPKEASGLTNLIKQFSLDRKHHPNGHVAVISKDGATCCGVFCAVYNAIEQLQLDDEVDIFTIVQQLQCRRPEMISTKEEYEFCFKAVSDFLNTDSVYANS